MENEFTFRGQPLSFWLRSRSHSDEEARWEAVDAIRHLCAPEESVPLMLDTLCNDGYWRARALAAHALYDLAIDEPDNPHLIKALPQLRSLASDECPEVREDINEVLSLVSG